MANAESRSGDSAETKVNMKIKCLILFVIIFSTKNLVLAQKNAKPFQKGDLRLDIKLPHVNLLSFNPKENFKDSEIGFNGYGIGFEYSYREKKFIEVSGSFAMTFELPFPAPIDAEYNKILVSTYANVTDNFIIKRFTIGYGLNYSVNTWREWTRDLGSSQPLLIYNKEISNEKLGVTMNSYYRVGRTFNIGFIYQPNFYNLTDKSYKYEHLLSLELNWRIKLLKIGRK